MDYLILAQVGNGAFRALKPRSGMSPHNILIIQIAIIAVALLILWWMLKGYHKNKMFSSNDKPLDILNKRYAAGELTKEEYKQLKKDIGK